MECGGKRSATPLCLAVERGGIAAALHAVVLMGMDCGGDSAKRSEATGAAPPPAKAPPLAAHSIWSAAREWEVTR